MIHNLRVKNFYSIDDEVEVSFVAKNGSITVPELYLNAPFDTKVTKIAFVGGANGAGKTNLLRPIAFLQYMLTHSAMRNDIEVIPYLPFAANIDSDSEISVKFSIGNDLFDYDISFNKLRIINEALYVTNIVSERATRKKIYIRSWKNKKYITDVTDLAKNLLKVEDLDRALSLDVNKNKTIISLYANMDSIEGYLRKVLNYWGGIYTNIVSFGNMESEFSTSQLANAALRAIVARTQGGDISNKLLKSADVGFSGITEFRSEQDPKFLSYGIQHSFGKNIFSFPVAEESTGTNRIVYLVERISDLLSRPEGSVAIIDDMDAFIHPDIYTILVEQFMSPSANKNGTQLILSSHNYTTLNSLDKQQIILTERNANGATEAWRLDQMKDVASHDNFYAKYMAGKYGAVPRVGEI